MNNAASQPMEHFPFLDSLWFGEFFNYDESPEYWLVEMSGIPYGLMNEMLEGGGNPWRGMTMGMTAHGLAGAPRGDLEVLGRVRHDRFADDRVLGGRAVPCGRTTRTYGLLCTLSLAKRWCPWRARAGDDATCRLNVDWAALGLDPSRVKITASAIKAFQDACEFKKDEPIHIPKGKGWLLMLAPRADTFRFPRKRSAGVAQRNSVILRRINKPRQALVLPGLQHLGQLACL